MIVGIAMVRDEEDVIGHTVAHHLAEGVDHIVISDNLSADGTRDILEKFAADGAVTVLDDLEPGYYQHDKMTALAAVAFGMGAEWVLPFDADEVFYAQDQTLAEFFAGSTVDIVQAAVWDHIVTAADDRDVACPFRRISHRRPDHQRLPKVAFRAHRDVELHMGNHDVERPGERGNGLYARHFQYRTFEQMAHKVRVGRAAYEASDLHERYGTHWRALGALDDEALAAEWRALRDEPGLVLDPAPVRCS